MSANRKTASYGEPREPVHVCVCMHACVCVYARAILCICGHVRVYVYCMCVRAIVCMRAHVCMRVCIFYLLLVPLRACVCERRHSKNERETESSPRLSVGK